MFRCTVYNVYNRKRCVDRVFYLDTDDMREAQGRASVEVSDDQTCEIEEIDSNGNVINYSCLEY